MKISALVAMVMAMALALALSTGSSFAVSSGKTVEYKGGDRGAVVFDGKAHAAKALKCPDCHTNPKLYEMKKAAEPVKMAAMGEGKSCGACHDGKKAFGVKAEADCGKCHKK